MSAIGSIMILFGVGRAGGRVGLGLMVLVGPWVKLTVVLGLSGLGLTLVSALCEVELSRWGMLNLLCMVIQSCTLCSGGVTVNILLGLSVKGWAMLIGMWVLLVLTLVCLVVLLRIRAVGVLIVSCMGLSATLSVGALGGPFEWLPVCCRSGRLTVLDVETLLDVRLGCFVLRTRTGKVAVSICSLVVGMVGVGRGVVGTVRTVFCRLIKWICLLGRSSVGGLCFRLYTGIGAALTNR